MCRSVCLTLLLLCVCCRILAKQLVYSILKVWLNTNCTGYKKILVHQRNQWKGCMLRSRVSVLLKKRFILLCLKVFNVCNWYTFFQHYDMS